MPLKYRIQQQSKYSVITFSQQTKKTPKPHKEPNTLFKLKLDVYKLIRSFCLQIIGTMIKCTALTF